MRRTLTLLVSALTGALIAALVVVAVPAEGAPNGGGPGDPLLLSRVNQAAPMTVLKTNGGFRILAKSPKRPPLMIYSPDSMPPLQVSSKAKVRNLNADLLDGMDSTEFVRDTNLVAAYAGGEQSIYVSNDTVVRSLTLTPPTSGHLIVNSTANVEETMAGDTVECSITTGTTVWDANTQVWESAGDSGSIGQLAGTQLWAVNGGLPFTVNLVCENEGTSGSSIVNDSALSAIFIPDP